MMDNTKKLEVKEKLFNLADQLADGEITIDETLDKLNGNNDYIDVEAINNAEFEHISLNGEIVVKPFLHNWYEIGEQYLEEVYLLDVNKNNLVRFINGLASQIHIY